MSFKLSPLPYDKDALAPFLSSRTLEFHHDRHHAAYVKKLNELVQGTRYEGVTLEDVIRATADDKVKPTREIFNNASQVWNHDFFWRCMKPKGGGKPSGALAERIDHDFGGYDQFREEFTSSAETQFGSGWAWLVLDGGRLKVTQTGNAVDPVASGNPTLLTIDVWEHAYYLDFQNRRPDFIAAFLDHLVDWDFVAGNYETVQEKVH